MPGFPARRELALGTGSTVVGPLPEHHSAMPAPLPTAGTLQDSPSHRGLGSKHSVISAAVLASIYL